MDKDTSQPPQSDFSGAEDYVRENWVPMVVGFVLSTIAGVILMYALQFGQEGLSPKTGVWGEFGDYFGGVLNPIVAFAALLVLAYSVRIQRTELRETKEAMRAQAQHSEDMVWLSAMVAVIDFQERRLLKLREEERSMPGDLASGLNSNVVSRRKEIVGEMAEAENRRDTLLNKVDQMVEQTALQELRRLVGRFGR